MNEIIEKAGRVLLLPLFLGLSSGGESAGLISR